QCRTACAGTYEPTTARPTVSPTSREYPSRSSTTAAHSVSTGARLMLIVPGILGSLVRFRRRVRPPPAPRHSPRRRGRLGLRPMHLRGLALDRAARQELLRLREEIQGLGELRVLLDRDLVALESA